jgi:hypothetical protein
MPDDLSFATLQALLDTTRREYRSFESLGMDEQNRRMAEYLSGHGSFERAGHDRGIAWGMVKDGGLVVFDNSGSRADDVTPVAHAPSDTSVPGPGPAAAGIAEKAKSVMEALGPLMGDESLPESEYRAHFDKAVSALQAFAADLPGSAAQKKDRSQRLHDLLALGEGGGGSGGQAERTAALFSSFQDLLKSLGAQAADTQGGPAPAAAACHYGVPASRIAMLVTSFDKAAWFENVCECLAPEEYGYKATPICEAGIEQYMAIPPCGVLVIHSHSFVDRGIRQGGDPDHPEFEPVYGIYTATPVLPSTPQPEYQKMWRHGLLAIHGYEAGDYGRFHWSITPLFVETYWNFEKNAFVLLDCCHSMRDIAAPLRKALHAKGASLIAGWTWRALDGISETAGSYLIDRMVGANRIATGATPIPPEEAEGKLKQRPFDWQALREDMAAKGLGIGFDRKWNAVTELLFDADPSGDFGLLRPSIKYVETREEDRKLILHGLFGKRPNHGETVKVDGHELPIDQWNDDGTRIECSDLLLNGAGSEGPVVVEIEGHESNKVPLTGWHFQFTYTIAKADAPDKPIATVTFPVFDRGDVHRVRDKPGHEPHPRPTGILMVRDPDQKLVFSVNGSCTFGDTTYRWSGSGEIRPGDDPRGAFAVWMWYQVRNGAFPEMFVDVGTAPEDTKYSIKRKGKEVVTDAPWPIIAGYAYQETAPGPQIEMLESKVAWDPRFDIDGDSRTWSIDFTADHHPGTFIAKLRWEDVEAKFPPDDDLEV